MSNYSTKTSEEESITPATTTKYITHLWLSNFEGDILIQRPSEKFDDGKQNLTASELTITSDNLENALLISKAKWGIKEYARGLHLVYQLSCIENNIEYKIKGYILVQDIAKWQINITGSYLINYRDLDTIIRKYTLEDMMTESYLELIFYLDNRFGPCVSNLKMI